MDAGIHVGLIRLSRDERDHFWEIWEGQQEVLHKICLKQFKGNEDAAADALSGLMMKSLDVWTRRAPQIASLPSWLCRMAYNFCNDLHRKTNVRSDTDLQKKIHGSLDIPETNPEQLLFQREKKDMLHKLLRDMPENLAVPFILRFHEELSYSAIGARLGYSETVIRKRVQRARLHLKNKMSLMEAFEKIR